MKKSGKKIAKKGKKIKKNAKKETDSDIQKKPQKKIVKKKKNLKQNISESSENEIFLEKNDKKMTSETNIFDQKYNNSDKSGMRKIQLRLLTKELDKKLQNSDNSKDSDQEFNDQEIKNEPTDNIKKDPYRHKKILNKSTNNNSRISNGNIYLNFNNSHNNDSYLSNGNLEKKRYLQIYKDPTFDNKREVKNISLINNSLISNNNNNINNSSINNSSMYSTNFNGIFNFMGQKIERTKYKNKEDLMEYIKNQEKNNNNLQYAKEDDNFLSDGKTINEFKLKSLRLTVKEYDNNACCILEISENIFACGFLYGEIDIYDSNDIICLFTIIEHKSRINNMYLLKEKNTILTSSSDHTMKKIKINELNRNYEVEFIFTGYESIIYKAIELMNKDILSISFNGSISIWNKVDEKNYIYKKKQIVDEEILIDVLEVKEEIVAISTEDKIFFFNYYNCRIEGLIKDLNLVKKNNLALVNEELLAVLLKHEIALVNVSQKIIVQKINIPGNNKMETISVLRDKTLLVTESNNKEENISLILKQYEIKNNKFILLTEKKEISEKNNDLEYSRITSSIELKNGIVVFCTSGFVNDKLCGTISIFEK